MLKGNNITNFCDTFKDDNIAKWLILQLPLK